MSGVTTATVSSLSERRDASRMSPGDRAHWERVHAWRGRVGAGSDGPGGVLGGMLGGALRMLPGPALVDRAVEALLGEILDGLRGVGHHLGPATITADGVLTAFRAAGHDVGRPADLRTLEVDDVHAVRPPLGRAYAAAVLAQGGALGLATGLSSSVCGLPGVATAVAAVGADAVLSAALGSRAVAHVGAYYGYDLRSPGSIAPGGTTEREHARGILDVGLRSDGAGRAAALRRLQVGRPPRSLPGAGAGPVGAARTLLRVVDTADVLYAERFLGDRYGLGASAPRTGARAEDALSA